MTENTSTSRATSNDDDREFPAGTHIEDPNVNQEITLLVATRKRFEIIEVSHEVIDGDVEVQVLNAGVTVVFEGVTGAPVDGAGTTIELANGATKTNPIDTVSTNDAIVEVGKSLSVKITASESSAVNYQVTVWCRYLRDDVT